jgi:hypothetical protein
MSRKISDIFNLVISIKCLPEEFKESVKRIYGPINSRIGYISPENKEMLEEKALEELGYLAEICYPPSETPDECTILVCGSIMNKTEAEVIEYMKQRIQDRRGASMDELRERYENISLVLSKHQKNARVQDLEDPVLLYKFQKKEQYLLSLKIETEELLALGSGGV